MKRKSTKYLAIILLLPLLSACNNKSSSVEESSSQISTSEITSEKSSEKTSEVTSEITSEATSEVTSEQTSEITSVSSEESSSQQQSSSQDEKRLEVFTHKFLQSDFSGSGYDTKAGTKDINGLTWSYSDFSFLGQSSDGIQIGSKKAPQTSADPWVLSTNFGEEVTISSITVAGKNPTGTTMVITADKEYNQTESLTNTEYDINVFDELEIETNQITFSFSVETKAFYFDYLSIALYVDNESQLALTSDESSLVEAEPGKAGVPITKYEATTKDAYYADVDLQLTGDALKNALTTKISTMTAYSYGNDTNILLYVDAVPENGKYLYGLYDGDYIGAQVSGTWNKEHVWACSQMGLGGDKRPNSDTKNKSSDLHNLRVSCQNSNGAHGNKFYDNTITDVTFYPNINGDANLSHKNEGDHRGDVARILFYMATRYTELHLDDNLDVNDDYSMGKLSVLKQWNEEDPVDAFEIQRNNRIYEYQGNRNPFIDYPELVNQIW